MSRNEWRLRGLYRDWVLVRRGDLRAGEETVRRHVNIVPDLLNPGDPFSLSEVLQWCRTFASQFHLPESAAEQLTYLERQITGALARGDLVMVRRQPDVSDIHVAAPQKRGGGNAWRVNAGTDTCWVIRREHVLHGDTVIQLGETERIINGLLERAASGNLADVHVLLNDTTPLPAKHRPDIRQLRSRLESAFRSGEIVFVRARASGAGGGGSDSSTEAAEPDGSAGSDRARSKLSGPDTAPKHWIEIQLVGYDGKPVPSEKYRIQLPTGDFADGQLDNDGRARVAGLDHPGTCKVTFPNLEADAWARV